MNNLPTLFLGAFYRWMTDQGISSKELLANTQISDAKLASSQATVALEQHINLICNAINITKKSHLGFEFGKSIGINALGIVGHAALNCRVLEEAICIIDKNFRVFSPMLSISKNITKKNVILKLTDIEMCSAIKIFRMECFISIIYYVLENLTQMKNIPMSANVTYQKPDDWQRFSTKVPFLFRFEQSDNQVIFPKKLLEFPLPNYEPVTLNMLSTTLDVCRYQSPAMVTLLSQLRQYIVENIGSNLSLELAAKKLGLSSRTLRRLLNKQGTSFQSLVDQERQQLAIMYLSSYNHSIEDIAFRLGYQDASSFARAFKKWMGLPPSQFRKSVYIN